MVNILAELDAWQMVRDSYPDILPERLQVVEDFAARFDFTMCSGLEQETFLKSFVDACEKYPFIEARMKEFIRQRPVDDKLGLEVITKQEMARRGFPDTVAYHKGKRIVTMQPDKLNATFHEIQHEIQFGRGWRLNCQGQEILYERFLSEADAAAVDALLGDDLYGAAQFFEAAEKYRLEHPEAYRAFLEQHHIPLSEVNYSRHQLLYTQTLGHNWIRKLYLTSGTEARRLFCDTLGVRLSYADYTNLERWEADYECQVSRETQKFSLFFNLDRVIKLNQALTREAGVRTNIRSLQANVLMSRAHTSLGVLANIVQCAIASRCVFYALDSYGRQCLLARSLFPAQTHGLKFVCNKDDYIDVSELFLNKNGIVLSPSDIGQKYTFCDADGNRLPADALPVRAPFRVDYSKAQFDAFSNAVSDCIDMEHPVYMQTIHWWPEAEVRLPIKSAPDGRKKGDLVGCYSTWIRTPQKRYLIQKDILDMNGQPIYRAGDFISLEDLKSLTPERLFCLRLPKAVSPAELKTDYLLCDENGCVTPEDKVVFHRIRVINKRTKCIAKKNISQIPIQSKNNQGSPFLIRFDFNQTYLNGLFWLPSLLDCYQTPIRTSIGPSKQQLTFYEKQGYMPKRERGRMLKKRYARELGYSVHSLYNRALYVTRAKIPLERAIFFHRKSYHEK